MKKKKNPLTIKLILTIYNFEFFMHVSIFMYHIVDIAATYTSNKYDMLFRTSEMAEVWK